MFNKWLRNGSVMVAALGLCGVHAWAGTPAENPLLRLVPSNVQIVAGIEDPHHQDQSGRLVVVTFNDNADLSDWISLAGVDDRQQVDKVIEVAASSPRGTLSEHLLLARGSFDGRRILETARENGNAATHYDGIRVVEVKPYLREAKEMQDTRWLAIPDDSTVIFGSPALVKVTLDRYVRSAAVDTELAKRVSELQRDVNCWSVLMMPVSVMKMHLLPGVLDEAGAALFERVSSVSLSVHYGSKARVDFVFGMEDAAAANALESAIQSTSRRPAQLLPAADELHSRLDDMSVRGNEVRGSMQVGRKEFDPWLAGLNGRARASAGGLNVAQTQTYQGTAYRFDSR